MPATYSFCTDGLLQPVHLNDLAKSCISAKENDLTINKLYNIGGLKTIALRDLIIKIFINEKIPIFQFQNLSSFLI